MVIFIWDFISHIGIKPGDDYNTSISKKIFNRSLLFLWLIQIFVKGIKFVVNDESLVVSSVLEQLTVNTFGVLIIYTLSFCGFFRFARAVFILAFPFIQFIPSLLHQAKVYYPYSTWAGSITDILPLIIVLFIFDKNYWKSGVIIFLSVGVLSFLDILILPYLGLAEPIPFERYFIIKSARLTNLIILAYLAFIIYNILNQMNRLMETTEESFKEKREYLEEMEKQVNAKIDEHNMQNFKNQ
jgi:hypothetical protein